MKVLRETNHKGINACFKFPMQGNVKKKKKLGVKIVEVKKVVEVEYTIV